MRFEQYICISAMLTCCIFLLSTVIAVDLNLVNGIVIGKVHRFHLAMLLLATSCLVATMLTKSAKQLTFSMPDGLVLGLAAIVTLTYNWQLNPEPEKMLFGGQLVVQWFLIRFIFTRWPQLRLMLLTGIVVTGLIEATSGIRQLQGLEGSNHSLFRLTGDFYNPGPYSGYLALVLPVCLWMVLHFDHYKKEEWKQTKMYLYYLAWITLLAIIVVLPAGMSRTAWIATVISCTWVYWMQRIGWKKTKTYIYKYRTLTIISSVLILVLVIGTLVGIFLLKQESANGRLLLWKVTERAIMKQPLTGTGLGGFPAAYAEVQAEYFTSGKASEAEKIIAGCPEYGFNEFLQIGLEQGMFGLMFFVLLLSYSLFRGVKSKQIGAAGGILALMFFSLASYPLQLPEFWVVLVVLMGVANTTVSTDTPPTSSQDWKRLLSIAMVGGLTMCCGWLFWQQNEYYKGYKKWNTMKVLYNSKAYVTACDGYEKLVPLMGHKPELLFETSQCLSKTGRVADANELLRHAMKLSADPMIHYVVAKNEQTLGNFQEAEYLLLHAIEILPDRIYPYYLLAKLYSEPMFFQKEKLFHVGKVVLKKKPKVESSAIQEMKDEIESLFTAHHL